MSNTITIIGNVGTDPTPIVLPGGARKVTFRLAASERYFDRKQNEWVDADPSWFTVEAFRALGEHVQASVHRGDNVIVSGTAAGAHLGERQGAGHRGRRRGRRRRPQPRVGHQSAYSKAQRTEPAVAARGRSAGREQTPSGISGQAAEPTRRAAPASGSDGAALGVRRHPGARRRGGQLRSDARP